MGRTFALNLNFLFTIHLCLTNTVIITFLYSLLLLLITCHVCVHAFIMSVGSSVLVFLLYVFTFT